MQWAIKHGARVYVWDGENKYGNNRVSTLLTCIRFFSFVINSTSTTSTSTEKRKSLCVTGRSALENRGLLKPSICWWFICEDTRGRSHTSALWVSIFFTYTSPPKPNAWHLPPTKTDLKQNYAFPTEVEIEFVIWQGVKIDLKVC